MFISITLKIHLLCQRKYTAPFTKVNRQMWFREITAVYPKNHKNTNSVNKALSSLILNKVVRIVTTAFRRVRHDALYFRAI